MVEEERRESIPWERRREECAIEATAARSASSISS